MKDRSLSVQLSIFKTNKKLKKQFIEEKKSLETGRDYHIWMMMQYL